MEQQWQVFHIEKRTCIPGGLNRHITRQYFVTEENGTVSRSVWVPANADPEKSAGNLELVSRTVTDASGKSTELSIQHAVNRRLEEAGVTPHKGQNVCLEMILSGSHDLMAAMDRETLLRWAEDSVAWAKETFGKENVVSATLHVDELTPHIHLVAVPLVTGESRRTISKREKKISEGKTPRQYNVDHSKYRLCCNEVYTRAKLYEYHDSYSQKVSVKYGLERGEKAEYGCHKKHVGSIEFNRMLAEKSQKEAELREVNEKFTNAKANLEKTSEALEQNRTELRSIRSFAFRDMIQQIPNLIKSDIHARLQGWPGEVISYNRFKAEVDGEITDFLQIDMYYNSSQYKLSICLEDGSVWYNDSPKQYMKKDGTPFLMKEMARYFTEQLTPNAKQLVRDFYSDNNSRDESETVEKSRGLKLKP